MGIAKRIYAMENGSKKDRYIRELGLLPNPKPLKKKTKSHGTKIQFNTR
jgi:hypothetical protein